MPWNTVRLDSDDDLQDGAVLIKVFHIFEGKNFL